MSDSDAGDENRAPNGADGEGGAGEGEKCVFQGARWHWKGVHRSKISTHIHEDPHERAPTSTLDTHKEGCILVSVSNFKPNEC